MMVMAARTKDWEWAPRGAFNQKHLHTFRRDQSFMQIGAPRCDTWPWPTAAGRANGVGNKPLQPANTRASADIIKLLDVCGFLRDEATRHGRTDGAFHRRVQPDTSRTPPRLAPP